MSPRAHAPRAPQANTRLSWNYSREGRDGLRPQLPTRDGLGGGPSPPPELRPVGAGSRGAPGARLFGAEREEGSRGHVGAQAEPGGARADFVDRAASLGRTSRPESPERPGLPVRKAETGFYPWERRPQSSGAASEGEEGPRGSGISGREVRSPRAKGRRSGPFGPAATSVELSVRQEALRRLLRAARAGGGRAPAPLCPPPAPRAAIPSRPVCDSLSCPRAPQRRAAGRLGRRMNKTLSQGAPSCLATGSEGGRMQGQPRAWTRLAHTAAGVGRKSCKYRSLEVGRDGDAGPPP